MPPLVNVLSKDGTFLFRFNDGEFGSKWCGFWKKNVKYLDYFAFMINNEYLSSKNMEKFEFYNSQFCRYYFRTKDGQVTEDVACDIDRVIITIKTDFAAEINSEFGVNIRTRNQNYAEGKRYSLSTSRKKIGIEYNDKNVFISFDRGDFVKNEVYSVHTPGIYAKQKGFSKYFDDLSPQNKYVPGRINARINEGEEFNVLVSTSDVDNETYFKIIKNKMHHIKEYSDIINSTYESFKCDDVLNEGVMKNVIDSLYSYANFKDKEIYAGFPYFNEFWIRDTLLILPSFLSVNLQPFVRDVLLKISSLVDERGLPNVYGGDLRPLDVSALFIIAAYEYYRWTYDKITLDSLKGSVEKLANIAANRIENGLVHDKGKETWMDSINREFSIEIQAMWYRAFKCAGYMLEEAGAGLNDFSSKADSIKKNINRFKREDYFSDQLNKEINSCNQIFLVYYNVLDESDSKLVTEAIDKYMLNEYGVMSLSKTDKDFSVNGYHNGAVWPFLTSILMGCSYVYGDSKTFHSCLKAISNNAVDSQCSSRINEIFQPDGLPMGCPSQAWSLCLIPHVIDRWIFGISVDAPNSLVEIKNSGLSPTGKRRFKVRERELALEFSAGGIKSNLQITDADGKKTIRL